MGLGATKSVLPPRLSQELYRLRQKRGHHTRLYSPEAASLYAEGHLDGEDLEDIVEASGPSRVLVERFDVLQLCCGKDAPLLDACSREGLRAAGPRIDLLQHSFWDLAAPRVFGWIFP